MSAYAAADFRTYVGIVAAIVATLAFIPYVLSILRGVTKPSQVSWFVWTFVGVTTAASYRASGASPTFWIAAAYVANSLIVALLSLKYCVKGSTRLDWVCFGGAIASLLAWLVLYSAPVALYLSVIADCLGVLPTLRKAWVDPNSEDRVAWLIGFAAAATSLLAVDDWAARISVYPLYCFGATGAVTGVLFFRKRSDDSQIPGIRPC